jgi:hypothetical protein
MTATTAVVMTAARTAAKMIVAALGLLLTSCQQAPSRSLDLDLIWVSSDPKVRTDTVGEGVFASQATFVLVDAQNRGSEAAMVTLGGTFRDGEGAVVGTLNPESLWIPAGERRMFALVDKARIPRPEARGAQILVYGAKITERPPIMRVTSLRSFDDYGKQIAQARLFNDANRPGRAIVIGAFYDAQNRPMARPFTTVPIDANSSLPLQLVGPPGSKTGTIFLGDMAY